MSRPAAGSSLLASHNPKQWNALKLLNEKGEFISGDDGREILDIVDKGDIEYATVDKLGAYEQIDDYIDRHIAKILALPLVDADKVKTKKFKVIVDCVNSTGAISIKPLLDALGCETVLLNEEMTGNFAHNPEPLPEHLRELSKARNL